MGKDLAGILFDFILQVPDKVTENLGAVVTLILFPYMKMRSEALKLA